MRWLVLLLGCAGCDILFQLQTVPAAHDAAITGSEPLADGSAAQHDEDGDGVPDVIDNCPTVSNADQLDVGEIGNGEIADMVGDACDPHPIEMGDRIALFLPFTTLGDIDSIGDVTPDGEAVMLGGNSALLSHAAVSNPSVAVVQLSWTGTADVLNFVGITIGNDQVQCGMQICGSAGSPATCLVANMPSGGGISTSWGPPPTDLAEIRFLSTNHECAVASLSNTGTLDNTYAFAPGKVGFATSGPTARVLLQNVIVYGF